MTEILLKISIEGVTYMKKVLLKFTLKKATYIAVILSKQDIEKVNSPLICSFAIEMGNTAFDVHIILNESLYK